MIKLYEEDFKYQYRLGAVEPFSYVFYVYGESANYLMNKYNLEPDAVIVYANVEKRIAIGNRRKKYSIWNIHPCDKEDIDELFNILEPIIKNDMNWYYECMCDDGYEKSCKWII